MTNAEYYKGLVNDLTIELNGVKDLLEREKIFNDLLIDERLMNNQEIKRLKSDIYRQHQEIQRLQMEVQRIINEKMVSNGNG